MCLDMCCQHGKRASREPKTYISQDSDQGFTYPFKNSHLEAFVTIGMEEVRCRQSSQTRANDGDSNRLAAIVGGAHSRVELGSDTQAKDGWMNGQDVGHNVGWKSAVRTLLAT